MRLVTVDCLQTVYATLSAFSCRFIRVLEISLLFSLTQFHFLPYVALWPVLCYPVSRLAGTVTRLALWHSDAIGSF